MVVKQEDKTSAAEARDLDAAATHDWSERAFPIPHKTVPVVIKRSLLEAIHEHGRSRTDAEVCGVLVGNGYRDGMLPFVYVEAVIRGEHAGSQLAQVTFTAETWNYIQDVMDREYAEKRIIGWYHTHPGFGIFLSPMDMFIQESFFSAAEQLALVYDPLVEKEGLFIWQQGAAVERSFLIEEDGEKDLTPTINEIKPEQQAGTIPELPGEVEPKPANRHLLRLTKIFGKRRRLWVGLTIVLLAASVVGYLLLSKALSTR